ncbi:hypothetical protein BSL78_13864 [Apostichopus japonicus]|uniref:Uncharacterized protein n=2 Tax=Stichopus japonicus TaxID=307972 RepID=A0A2G8KMQ6_STIJA|nr:hypothetical protein BSL78_13864 [Apostichopus japonicus]
MTSLVTYSEPWGNYLSSYLRPVAAQRPYCEPTFQSKAEASTPQLEELQVFPKGPQKSVMTTSSYNESDNIAPITGTGNKEDIAPIFAAQYGKTIDKVDYRMPLVNPGPFQTDSKGNTFFIDQSVSGIGAQQNGNDMTLIFGKDLKPEIFWKRSHGHNTQHQEAVSTPQCGGDSVPLTSEMLGNYDVSPYDMADFQKMQDLVRGESMVETEISTGVALHHQYNKVTAEYETNDRTTLDKTKLRKIPNFAIFGSVANSSRPGQMLNEAIDYPIHFDPVYNQSTDQACLSSTGYQ